MSGLRGYNGTGRSAGKGSLAGGGEVEASSLVELHVPDTTNGLDLGLEGAEVVVVSVVTALKQVLVASVSRVLVTHPPGNVTHKVSQWDNSVFGFRVCIHRC